MQLLQNGKQQFIDSGGLPLANGSVGFYAPGTLNPLTTYQDQGGTIQNTNPITLDSRGQAIVWGTGTYRQIVKDASGVTIWDQVVDAPAGGGALANTTGAGGAALIGFDGGTLAQFFLSKNNRVVDSIAALRALSKTTYTRAFVTGFYAAGDGGGGPYWYDPTDTTSTDNGGTIIVAGDGGRWKLIFTEALSVLQFGVKADAGTTDNSTALLNVRNWIAADPFKHQIYFPAGSYGYTVSPNWAIQNAVIRGIGEVHLKYTGTGDAVILDGSSAPNLGVYNMTMHNFTIDALTTSGNGALVKNCHHSIFKFKVRGAGASSAGIKTYFCVTTHFDNCEVSPNADGGWLGGAMPLYGFYVTGGVSTQTSYCTFTNPIAEACNQTNGAALFIECALGNVFNGGTFEGSKTGVLTATPANGCVSNKFFGTDMEVNSVQDIYEQGFNNEYHSCETNSLINITSAAIRPQFFGGQHQSISIAAGASYPGFFGLIWNRTGSGTFSIGDNSVRIRDCIDHINNKPGPFPQTNVVAGASPWTYTNSKGRDVVLAVSSGAVSQIQLIRGGTGTLIGPTSGFFPLSPGDQLQITYSAPPNIWEYTK